MSVVVGEGSSNTCMDFQDCQVVRGDNRIFINPQHEATRSSTPLLKLLLLCTVSWNSNNTIRGRDLFVIFIALHIWRPVSD